MKHGQQHLVCPFALHTDDSAGFKVLGMQMKVDDRDLYAELHLEEGCGNPRAAVAVGVCYKVQ